MHERLDDRATICIKQSTLRNGEDDRPALELTALRLLKSRMEQKNGIQQTLMQNGIVFKVDEITNGMPEIISEETFMDLLIMNSAEDDEMPTDIEDPGYEFDDLDDDGLTFV